MQLMKATKRYAQWPGGFCETRCGYNHPSVIGTMLRLHQRGYGGAIKPAQGCREVILEKEGSCEVVENGAGCPMRVGPAMQVDVYAFGIVMWELWTQCVPHEGLHQAYIMVHVMGESRPGS